VTRMSLLALLALFVAVGSARAAAPDPHLLEIGRSARAAIIAPVEWDGIWDTIDSVYTCAGVLQFTDPGKDTICGGKDYSFEDPGSGTPLDCNGTADATTLDVTCTGSQEAFPDCQANYSVTIHATRSGDTYFAVEVINVTSSGTAEGCDFTLCQQVNTHGTRTGPAPTLYCSTATRKATWGQVKVHYR
jgi:hypothetical protein